jgi:hypothetical protein
MQIPPDVLAQLDKRDPSTVSYVVIHHSVAPQTWDATQIAESEPFLTIGYNAYVRLNPISHTWEIQQGRPMNCVPAAQEGLNPQGYAICIAGNYQPNDGVTEDEVVDSALALVAQQVHLAREHGLGARFLIGHRDVETYYMVTEGIDHITAAQLYGTSCPGDLLYEWMDHLRTLTSLAKPAWLK